MSDMFDDMARMESARHAWVKFAQETFVPGIDPADLKPGTIVTVSPNLRVHDRSYTDSLWRVLHGNTSHVQLEAVTGYRVGKDPILLMTHEHHFYAAGEFSSPSLSVQS